MQLKVKECKMCEGKTMCLMDRVIYIYDIFTATLYITTRYGKLPDETRFGNPSSNVI